MLRWFWEDFIQSLVAHLPGGGHVIIDRNGIYATDGEGEPIEEATADIETEDPAKLVSQATKLLRKIGRIRKNLTTRQRFAVLKRCGFACAYCGSRPPLVVLHVDHVVPVSKGGTNAPENLVAACELCNQGKSNLPLDAP